MDKFHGNLEELKKLVESCGIVGNWQDNEKASNHSFRGQRGEVLNWWPSKGTIQFQGQRKDEFKALLSEMGDETENAAETIAPNEAKIFVVHGHDREARDQLELILMRLELQPYILQNSDGEGKTIVEALETNIYQRASFGVILLTPDDFGYAKSDGETEKKPRARQNVILEMGMVMAALGRKNMLILKKGALEMPSDTAGIIHVEFNDHVREIVPKLAERLQGAGFQIDPKKIAEASA